MLTLFDTHCHYAEARFQSPEGGREIEAARAAGLTRALVCATHPGDFEAVRTTAHRTGYTYALGIHPMLVSNEAGIGRAIERFDAALEVARGDSLLAAIGEIGLDDWPGAAKISLAAQERLFEALLARARTFDLPVSIHSRKALSRVLSLLKRTPVRGVLHAFAGSSEEAKQSLKLGLKLGFGPSLTYSGSRRIREVFAALSEDAFVLETDAPFMLTAKARRQGRTTASPADIFEVLKAAAELRGTSQEEIAARSTANALAVFGRVK